MKKYNFRLQKLLDMRINKEEECKRTFQKVQKDKFEAESKLNDLKNSYKKHNRVEQKGTTIERKMRQQYLSTLSNSINVATTDLEKKIKVVDDVRVELRQKQMDRKTVEILKEKSWQSYLKEQELIEQKTNDEFALYGFFRNLKGGELNDR
ncbi:flagellar export protein FliJ [uncultured Clostridium sp.]|uniref:flagellar export protein FliJ n=1 Tax=uncultured Clostridium sp. TaxID=59620 RepID=UPI0028E7774D|nr:flagellar export protein FliJ [uncultured Clostridium sp.]